MTERAPDPFRPGRVPEGRPFARLGRPGFALAVLAAIGVVIALAFVLALR